MEEIIQETEANNAPAEDKQVLLYSFANMRLKREHDADFTTSPQAGLSRYGFQQLPCETPYITSYYRDSSQQPTLAMQYAVYVKHVTYNYLIMMTNQAEYRHFMQQYSSLASIFDQIFLQS